jgi:DNA-binding winged helix-turn-helix (wHTH) protein
MQQGVVFGRYRFDASTGQLWSGKREIKLTPKAGAVLALLMTRAGEPVTKEDLFASVWKGTAVSDDALPSCIQELRKALADDAKQPRFIETRHRRGYRFIARLSQVTTQKRTQDSQSRGREQKDRETRLTPDAVGSAQTVAHLEGNQRSRCCRSTTSAAIQTRSPSLRASPKTSSLRYPSIGRSS